MSRLASARTAPRLAPIEARSGPALSDGTRLRDLIDFNKREVKMRVLSDPEIYRLELKRIFARSWIALGHVAEIPNAGDFVKRTIGEDQVIVARNREGEVSVFLNACSHRGMEICWADSGNKANFKCPYHGWVFDPAGNLIGAPFEKEMYGEWDKSKYGLRKLRTEIFLGRIFATFDDNAMPLDEWLEPAGYYLAHPYHGAEPEMEIVQTPRRFRVKCNWKTPSANNTGDGYHGLSLHGALAELGFSTPEALFAGLYTVKVSSDTRGHGLVGFPASGMEGLINHKGSDTQYSIENFMFNCVMFPASFGQGGNSRMTAPDGRSFLLANLGGAVPCGPDAFELWTATAIEKGAPDVLKQIIKSTVFAVDLNGGDDYEGWASLQNAARGVIGQEQPIRYNAVTGVSKPADWPGPGLVYAGLGKDDNEWNWWVRWYDMMSVDEALSQ